MVAGLSWSVQISFASPRAPRVGLVIIINFGIIPILRGFFDYFLVSFFFKTILPLRKILSITFSLNTLDIPLCIRTISLA